MGVKENFNKVWLRCEDNETARTSIDSKELNILKKQGAKIILDVGCGDGSNAAFLANQGFVVTGMDISDEGLKIAKQKAKGSQNNYLLQDIFSTLSFEDNCFDAVIAYQSLNHAIKPVILEAFKELGRVLKKDGIFIIRIANRETFNVEPTDKKNIYYDKDYDQTFEEIKPQTFKGIGGDEDGIIMYTFYEDELSKDLSLLGFKKMSSRLAPHHIVAVFANKKQ
ncbi:class I SAM-dependent methyltransferase [Candidatus Woesearchaeota archaeon]|nr:class I SAM-dependent methyltransferase [Candidatus Woesearchaeota archaeon]